ncbi:MAG: alpha/beta fold hydrolase [Gammaproteobacteria bacterium]|nr:alpha/beta fold hydrolase [Gammaproteobacteria bacterium]MDH4316589.1 alpha/beta fold hydrolase [Gammaproteobacteria bacterium]MDH5215965.1 alpha/beta fold hydrolase [Gammaproteobacteria bacterium]
MQKKTVSFDNKDGRKLAGLLDFPHGPVRAYALFAHCFTCSKNLKAANNISRALTDAGIAVLRFDFTGLGQSEGDFADSNFSGNVADLLAAAGFLETGYSAPSILIGHSLGGTAVLQAAANLPSVVAVATIGAPAQPSHVADLLGDARPEIESRGEATVNLGGRPFKVKKQFLDDLEQHGLPESLSALRKAILIMHAPLDDTVDISNASELFLNAKHPKSFVSLDKADHLLSRNEDSYYAGTVLACWAKAYLPDSDEDRAHAANETVAWTDGDEVLTSIVSAGHSLIADEPVAAGGSGAGPSPYDLLSAALAACTTMTLTMYARHKKLNVARVTAKVSHNKIHARDCEDCENKDGKIDFFERRIAIDGELSPEQHERMLEIADRCPVHKTLHGEVKIRTRADG